VPRAAQIRRIVLADEFGTASEIRVTRGERAAIIFGQQFVRRPIVGKLAPAKAPSGVSFPDGRGPYHPVSWMRADQPAALLL
jgi:hypothetical protein